MKKENTTREEQISAGVTLLSVALIGTGVALTFGVGYSLIVMGSIIWLDMLIGAIKS